MEIIAGNAIADAAGNAQVEVYPPGAYDFVVTSTGLTVTPDNPQPTATASINGVAVEGSYTGANDSSNTRFVLAGSDRYRIAWSGCRPGALCVMTVVGVLYPPGRAPKE